MDEDSILFQAMKNEMSPQVDQASMKIIPPGSPYQLGLEMRQGGPGGVVTNPTRMARQPSDFAGRQMQANDNPAKVRADTPYGETYVRPSGNVITQQQSQWERDKFANMIEQAQAQATTNPSLARRMLDNIRNFFNANRPPNSGLFD